jgi:DNA sulfur modification protein DndE
MAIGTFKLSQQEKDNLVKLKRLTGIQNWNVLCRWAFCVSLAEPSVPSTIRIPSDSSVEMTWKIFSGAHDEIYYALLKERCHRDGLGTREDILATQFRLHLHRGIGNLAANRQIKNVFGLIKFAINSLEEQANQ